MRKVLYILTQLSDDDVEWLSRAGQRRQAAAGTVLIREGEPNDALIFVLDGEVAVTVANVGTVAQLGVGEILGEMSFVDKSPPSATVTTLVSSQVLAIDRDLLSHQLQKDAAFASRFYLAVAMYLSVRMRATVQQFGKGSGAEEELNFALLDTVHVAGARFDRMIKKLLST